MSCVDTFKLSVLGHTDVSQHFSDMLLKETARLCVHFQWQSYAFGLRKVAHVLKVSNNSCFSPEKFCYSPLKLRKY